MLDALIKLFSPQDGASRREHAPATAVAALLVEVARADAEYTATEAAIVERLLAGLFGLDAAGAREARRAGEAAQAQAADLVRFTRVVKTELDESERQALMQGLWEVALSDAERDPHEDALLRKLAPLIAVSDRASAEARRRAARRDD